MHRFLLTFVIATALTGCSRTSLTEASKLAQAGQAATGELTAYYAGTSKALPAVLEMEVLRSAFDPDKYSPPSQAMVDSVKRVRISIHYRQKISQELGQLYSSMYELSATDYPGSFAAAYGQLGAEIGGFAKAIGKSNPLDTTKADEIAGIGLEILVREAQKRRVAKANALVADQLDRLAVLLDQDAAVVTAIRQQQASQVAQTSIALWKSGTVSAKKLFSEYGGQYGLEIVQSEDALTYKNPKIRKAVADIIQFRLDDIRIAEAVRYNAFSDTVKELISRHAEVAQGVPFDIESILTIVERLKVTLGQ